MTVAQAREFFMALPPEQDEVEIKAVRNYPDDASVKEIQQAVYRDWDNTVYLYLK